MIIFVLFLHENICFRYLLTRLVVKQEKCQYFSFEKSVLSGDVPI